MIYPNTLGQIVGPLPGLLTALGFYPQIYRVKDLVAKRLGCLEQLFGVCSDTLHIGDNLLVTLPRGFNRYSAHRVYDRGGSTAVNATTQWKLESRSARLRRKSHNQQAGPSAISSTGR